MTKPDISIVIPACNEEGYLPACLSAIVRASELADLNVETVVVLNRCTDSTESIAHSFGALTVKEDAKNIARIRNAGINASHADIVVTIDADSYFTEGTLAEIKLRLANPAVTAGGADFFPERRSAPIVMSYAISKWLAKRAGGSMALYWFRRSAYDAIGGFDEGRVLGEDIDFASRLAAHAKEQGERYQMLTENHVITSCRKFDQFGDWYALKMFLFSSKRFESMLDGTNQSDLDTYYYETRRKD